MALSKKGDGGATDRPRRAYVNHEAGATVAILARGVHSELPKPQARRPMIALMQTTDLVKLSAVQAVLRDQSVAAEVFDGAAGALWRSIIPVRLMVAEADLPRARRALAEAGFRQAGDGDWDL